MVPVGLSCHLALSLFILSSSNAVVVKTSQRVSSLSIASQGNNRSETPSLLREISTVGTMPRIHGGQPTLAYATKLAKFVFSEAYTAGASIRKWGSHKIPLEDVKKICKSAGEVLETEANVVEFDLAEADEQVHIVGDIHGRRGMLWAIFEDAGYPSEDNPYLFLGDYVDRGDYSIEVSLILLAYKAVLKEKFFMLRGNHELMSINDKYSLKWEALFKYGSDYKTVLREMRDAFKYLPVGALIKDTKKKECIFAAHGGIPHRPSTIDTINKENRKVLDISSVVHGMLKPIKIRNSTTESEIAQAKRETEKADREFHATKESIIAEMIWNDPWDESPSEHHDQQGGDNVKRGFFAYDAITTLENKFYRLDDQGYGYNWPRLQCYFYTHDATTRWIKAVEESTGYKLVYIVRGHEEVDHVRKSHNNKVLTIFSSYMYRPAIEVDQPNDAYFITVSKGHLKKYQERLVSYPEPEEELDEEEEEEEYFPDVNFWWHKHDHLKSLKPTPALSIDWAQGTYQLALPRGWNVKRDPDEEVADNAPLVDEDWNFF